MHNNPLIYEINTWAWLSELSRKYARPITLGDVPAPEWDAIAAYGFDFVWLMGVWERSPAGRRIGLANPALLAEFRAVLPDFNTADFPGSPFCIRRYRCDAHLGGPGGLAAARQALAGRGLRLILDFVPNHTSPDHPWAADHPEYYIQGSRENLTHDPDSFLEVSGSVIARGRDPYFPAWPDVIQLNLFHPELRQALTQTLLSICAQCDGLRVDMAMLAINRIFHGTWGERAGEMPAEEFLPEAIRQAKAQFPETLLIAEAYWDTERELHGLGFDGCYDKLLYDALRDENLPRLHERLEADTGYQARLLHFTENHDEQRAAAVFPDKKLFAANLATYTLPGARLFHQGQIQGSKIRLPVLLGRRPDEDVDEVVQSFYPRLIELLEQPAVHDGSWSLCTVEPAGSPLCAWTWQHENICWLIAVNLSGTPEEAFIHISNGASSTWDGILQLWMTSPGESLEKEDKISGNHPITLHLNEWGYLVAEITLL